MLGSIAPLSALYAVVTIEHILHEHSPEADWAFYAVWVMSFGGYVLSLLIGIGLAFVSKPASILGRFLLAASIPTLFYLVFAAIMK